MDEDEWRAWWPQYTRAGAAIQARWQAGLIRIKA
jgi:hypothetical protein